MSLKAKLIYALLAISLFTFTLSNLKFKNIKEQYPNLEYSKGIISEFTDEIVNNSSISKIQNFLSELSSSEQYFLLQALNSQKRVLEGKSGLTKFDIKEAKKAARVPANDAKKEIEKKKEEKKSKEEKEKANKKNEEKEKNSNESKLVKTVIKTKLSQLIRPNSKNENENEKMLIEKNIHISCKTAILKHTNKPETTCELLGGNIKSNSKLSEEITLSNKFDINQIKKLKSIKSSIKTNITGKLKEHNINKEVIVDCITNFSTGTPKVDCDFRNSSLNQRMLTDSSESVSESIQPEDKLKLNRLFDIEFWRKNAVPVVQDIKKDLVEYLGKVSKVVRSSLSVNNKNGFKDLIDEKEMKAKYVELIDTLAEVNQCSLSFLNTVFKILLANRKWVLTTDEIRAKLLTIIEGDIYNTNIPWVEADVKAISQAFTNYFICYTKLPRGISSYYEFVNLKLSNNDKCKLSGSDKTFQQSAFINHGKLSNDDIMLLTDFLVSFSGDSEFKKALKLYKDKDASHISKYNFIRRLSVEKVEASIQAELVNIEKKKACQEGEAIKKYSYKEDSTKSDNNNSFVIFIGCENTHRVFLGLIESTKEFSLEVEGITNKSTLDFKTQIENHLAAVKSKEEKEKAEKSEKKKRFLEESQLDSITSSKSGYRSNSTSTSEISNTSSESNSETFSAIASKSSNSTSSSSSISSSGETSSNDSSISEHTSASNSNTTSISEHSSDSNSETASISEHSSASKSETASISEYSSASKSEISNTSSKDSSSQSLEDVTFPVFYEMKDECKAILGKEISLDFFSVMRTFFNDNYNYLPTECITSNYELCFKYFNKKFLSNSFTFNYSNLVNFYLVMKLDYENRVKSAGLRVLADTEETTIEDKFDENTQSVQVVSDDPIKKEDSSAAEVTKQEVSSSNDSLDGTTDTSKADASKQAEESTDLNSSTKNIVEDTSVKEESTSKSSYLTSKILIVLLAILTLGN